ncbi:MAG: hypothetical protein JW900_03175 [Anaerolineae bacterium]|nr:hypothetical protein [Anaerolineae bacterium]
MKTFAWQGRVLFWYAQIVWRTARYTVQGQEHFDRARATGRPLIVTAWHGMTLPLPGYFIRREEKIIEQYLVVITDDPRTAMLEAMVRDVGVVPFAISMEDESMTAARRLIEMIRQMKEGKSLLLFPDGPDGPAGVPKTGAVFIAQKSRGLIVPMGLFTATAYRVPRWDRYMIPLPFSRIALYIGEPWEIGRQDELGQACDLLRRRLNKVEQAAEELYHVG